MLPDGRTLFLVNVPPDATDREITQFFKSCGIVERVVFAGEGDADEEEDTLDSDDEAEEGEESDENTEHSDESEDDGHPRKKRKTNVKEVKSIVPQVTPLPSHSLRILRRTGETAHVIFLEPSSVARALSLSSKSRPWPSDTSVPSGLAHYKALYASRRPPLDIVKDHADSWMEMFEFEKAKSKQNSRYRKGEAIVDEDGFTLVTRGGAYGQTVGGGVGVASKKFQNQVGRGGGTGKRSRKNKKGPKEKESFYAFQLHEKKRKGECLQSLDETCTETVCLELIDLKAKFEEDKAKVEKLKASRKFKPY